MKAEEFKKLAVVSIDSGAKLGYVDDLLFDPGKLSLAGFAVKLEGHQSLVPLGAIRSVGRDAITVPNDAAVHTASAESALASLPRLEQMHKLKVVDEAGNYIGRVKELDVNPDDGRISQIEAHEGGVLGIGGTTTTITGDDIRSIGEEIMVVSVAPPTKPTE